LSVNKEETNHMILSIRATRSWCVSSMFWAWA